VNPIWHALGAAQSVIAESVGNARRHFPDMSPFAGLPHEPVADDRPSCCVRRRELGDSVLRGYSDS
jgi:hypothetical protein